MSKLKLKYFREPQPRNQFFFKISLSFQLKIRTQKKTVAKVVSVVKLQCFSIIKIFLELDPRFFQLHAFILYSHLTTQPKVLTLITPRWWNKSESSLSTLSRHELTWLYWSLMWGYRYCCSTRVRGVRPWVVCEHWHLKQKILYLYP